MAQYRYWHSEEHHWREICEGIRDHSYFIRMFRKITAITPQEYRRRLKLNDR